MKGSRVTRALAHGAYVGATGDLSRLKAIRAKAETDLVGTSWNAVGTSLRSSAVKVSKGKSKNR